MYIKKCNYGLLRVLGIICICIMHYRKLLVGDVLVGMGQRGFNLIADYGSAMVPFFFMLSGYCIALKYVRCKVEDKLLFFIRKRVYVLVPAALFSTLIMACLQWIYFFLHNQQWWTGREATLYNVLGNFLGLQSIIPRQFMDTVNGPTWYIYSLLVCYLCFWMVYQLHSRHKVKLSLLWILVFVLSAGAMIYNVELVFINSTNGRALMGFAMGCISAYETVDRHRAWIYEKVLAGMCIVVLGLCILSRLRIIGNVEFVLCFSFYPLVINSVRLIQDRYWFDKLDFLSIHLRNVSLFIYLYNLPSLILMSIINDGLKLDIRFERIETLLFVMGINFAVGELGYWISQCPYFRRLKDQFIINCEKLLNYEEGVRS